MDHRLVRRQIDALIEMAQLPFAGAVRNPIDRMQGIHFHLPVPAHIAPEIAALIAVVGDECGEFGVGHRRPGDLKRINDLFVTPFLVIEQERRGPIGAQAEAAAGYLHVARVRAPVQAGGIEIPGDGQWRLGIFQGLAGVGIGFGVHVFVEGGELVDEAVLLGRHIVAAARQPLADLVENVLHIFEAAFAPEDRQVPADAMLDIDGIVERVAIAEQRRLAIKQAQHELLGKPGHVPHLPQKWIYGAQARADNLLVVEGVEQLQRAGAGVGQGVDQILVADDFGHGR